MLVTDVCLFGTNLKILLKILHDITRLWIWCIFCCQRILFRL